jgi:poly(3-hydroxybutyrate) depolymerase
VVFTMHGSGGDGASMVEQWRPVATRECLLVVGLDSSSGSSWNFNGDVTNFDALYTLVDEGYDVAAHYLHGYSAGAHWTYIIGISNSEYFTGIGVYAGSLAYAEEWGYWPDDTEAPIPVAIAHGTADSTVPYREAQHAYDSLTAAGWPADLYTVDGGTHAYDPSCQDRAWELWTEERAR